MKKFITAAILAVAAWGLSGLSYAEDSQAQPGANDKLSTKEMKGGKMDDRLDNMKKDLGLSDAQVAKLKDLFKSNHSKSQAMRDQFTKDAKDLQAKVDAKASDADLNKAMDTLASDRDKMEASRTEMRKAMRAILTPSQAAKLAVGRNAKIMEKMKGSGGAKRHRKGKTADAGNTAAPASK